MRPYQPYGSALELMRYKDPDRITEVILDGPAGTGKSRASLEKLHLCAEKYPGMRGLIVRKTRASLTETGLVTFEQKVVPQGHAALLGPSRKFRQSYAYPNGSELVVAGLDNPTRIMSTEFDMIYVQEAIELKIEDHEALTTRLRNFVMPYQQLLGDTNPDGPRHWIKQRESAGSLRLIQSRHEDNPVLWDRVANTWTRKGKQYIETLERLTGVRYLRLRKGLWVAAEGIVYRGWDPAVHRIFPFPIPQYWRRIRVIDFGYVHPFVCQWWAIDPDCRMYLYRQIFHSQRTVADHAKQILALTGDERIEATICDHDAEDRATLEQNGIPNERAIKDVKPGIERVEHRLRPAGDGKPRIYFMRDSLVERDDELEERKLPIQTEDEFDTYVWDEKKEEPIKKDDDGMDATRYAVSYVDENESGRGSVWVSDISWDRH